MNVIERSAQSVKEKVLSGALLPIRPFLDTRSVEIWCGESNHRWRERHFGPAITLLACVWKQLQATASSRAVEDWMASFSSAAGKRDGHDFCAARARLPLHVFERATRHVGAQAALQSSLLFQGLRVQVLDGTTSRTPRSEVNRKHFGCSRNGHSDSTLPVVRWMVLVCAGCAAVLDAAVGSYATSEMRLARMIIERLPTGNLLVVDRGFCAFLLLYLTQRRGSHILAHHHQTRRGTRIRKLGRNDEIHSWRRPSPWRTVWPDLLADCPRTMNVRVIRATIQRPGYRSYKLTLCTTLLDAERYPSEELVDLYLARWHVELDLRTLKDGYQLGRLSGQTPAVVERELYSGLLAYNCIRALQADSGAPRYLSHARARVLTLSIAERMSGAPTVRLPMLYDLLLKLIGEAEAPLQERLPQPRGLIQRPSPFAVLTMSRKAWRKKYTAA